MSRSAPASLPSRCAASPRSSCCSPPVPIPFRRPPTRSPSDGRGGRRHCRHRRGPALAAVARDEDGNVTSRRGVCLGLEQRCHRSHQGRRPYHHGGRVGGRESGAYGHGRCAVWTCGDCSAPRVRGINRPPAHSGRSERVRPVGQFTAMPRDSRGENIFGRVMVWTVADSSIATIDSDGFVLGVRAGTTLVRATSDGVSATAEVIVGAGRRHGGRFRDGESRHADPERRADEAAPRQRETLAVPCSAGE